MTPGAIDNAIIIKTKHRWSIFRNQSKDGALISDDKYVFIPGAQFKLNYLFLICCLFLLTVLKCNYATL